MSNIKVHVGRYQPVSRSTLHTTSALAIRAAVKTELSYRNDTIITFFFAANKYKGTARVALSPLIVNLKIRGLI